MVILTILLLICAILSVIFAFLEWKKRKQQDLQIKVINNYFPDIKLDFFPKNEEELKHKLEQRYGLIREDLLEREFYVSSPIARYKIIIERLNKYLSKRDIDIIIVASSVCRAQDEEKHSLAQQLHVSLVDLYGDRGKRIFNRLNSNVFEEKILPFLRELEELLPHDVLRISKMFQEYFDSIVEHEIVDRLWVSDNDDYTSVLSRIIGKFTTYPRLNLLDIYARKEINVTFTEMACKEFIRRNANKFILEKTEPKKMRGRIAITFKIKRK